MFVNPTCRWTTIAGTFRFFGGYAIGFFMPNYFGTIYGDKHQNEYSILNSIVVSFCGFMSALVGGIVSDHYYKKGIYRSKAYICIFCGVMGVPTIAACLLLQNNFYLSIGMLALEYLVAEGWVGPAITMVVNTISAENKGLAVGAYLFCCTAGGTISPIIYNKLTDAYIGDDKSKNHLYG